MIKMFNPCVLIPVYNHGGTLPLVLDELSSLAIPVIVVDDGSNAETKQQIEQAQEQYHFALVTLAENGGKGAAVKAGLREAQRQTYSHALQVDADVQHDLSKSQTLLHFAQTWPGSVVSAQPIYGADAPFIRVYARYLSHVWVWLETLSFEISETMCGFRVYPVSDAVAIIDTASIGNRMSFDTEILVRLHWRGLPVIMCPVEVRYPEQGVSHFRMVHDNAHHVWMHVKLLGCMLIRLPVLIARKCKRAERPDEHSRHWSEQNERGNSLGLQTLMTLYRVFGMTFIQALLLPVTLYFVIQHHIARQSSQAFLKRVQAQRAALGLSAMTVNRFSTFRHIYTFSLATFEKVRAWHDEQINLDIKFPNRPEMQRLKASVRGGLIICSHLGYNDLIRAIAQRSNRATVNILVYHQHAMKYNALIKKINPDSNVNLIHVNKIIPEIAILLKEKVDKGELVFVAGDRTSHERHGRDVILPFIGENAAFPHGPAVLAHLLECPVYFFFCLKINNSYHIHFEKYAERFILVRKQRQEKIRVFMQSFVKRLELFALHHPYQWFNFFDFWEQHNDRSRPAIWKNSTSY